MTATLERMGSPNGSDRKLKNCEDGQSEMIMLREAAKFIREKLEFTPGQIEIAITLGSGLGTVAEKLSGAKTLDYSEIPGFKKTSIEGHRGRLVLGSLSGVKVLGFQGRFHLYEGFNPNEVVFPIRTAAVLGVRSVILTNAAGAINTRYRPGELMILEDHINLTGLNPLIGPNLAELGPRFPDMTQVYDRELMDTYIEHAFQKKVALHRGVYLGILGPSYETPAEIRMFRTMGADAVGMSTVLEAIAARHAGMKVTGISAITNLASGLSGNTLSHAEVVTSSADCAERLYSLLLEALPSIDRQLGKDRRAS